MGNRSCQETAALTSLRVEGEANPYGVCCGRSSGQNCHKYYILIYFNPDIYIFLGLSHLANQTLYIYVQSSPLQLNSFDNQSITDTASTYLLNNVYKN
jgi:hypothetical protein